MTKTDTFRNEEWVHVARIERSGGQPALFKKRWKAGPKGMPDVDYWAEREDDLIHILRQKKVPHVVECVGHNNLEYEITTVDAGPALHIWRGQTVQMDGREFSKGPFERMDEFLRLLRQCLKALKGIHEAGFVHCDIKADNICVPAGGEGARQFLDYKKLALIDFTFSTAKELTLEKHLPISWSHEDSYYLSSAFKKALAQGIPKAVEEVDFSSDLYSLGQMAKDIYFANLASMPGPKQRNPRLERLLEEFDQFNNGLPLKYRFKNIGNVHDKFIKRVENLLRSMGVKRKDFLNSLPFEILETRPIDYRSTPVTPVRQRTVEAAQKQPPPKVKGKRETAASQGKESVKPRPYWRLAVPIVVMIAGGVLVYQLTQKTPTPIDVVTTTSTISATTQPQKEITRTTVATPPPTAPPSTTLPAPSPDTIAKKKVRQLEKDFTDAEALARVKQMADDGVASADKGLKAYIDRVNDLFQAIKTTPFYEIGKGAPPKVWDEYQKRLETLAQIGDGHARLQLAALKYRGVGTAASPSEAMKATLAVLEDKGISAESRAQGETQLARMMQNAYVNESHKLIADVYSRFRSQAHNGNPVLQLQMARIYRKGLLGEVNEDNAQFWYEKAAAQAESKYGQQAVREMKAM